jgi:hypothetical protein
MSKELQEVVVLWKQYTEETKESRRVPEEQVTDDMRERGFSISGQISTAL